MLTTLVSDFELHSDPNDSPWQSIQSIVIAYQEIYRLSVILAQTPFLLFAEGTLAFSCLGYFYLF
jgi:hypothetical protein